MRESIFRRFFDKEAFCSNSSRESWDAKDCAQEEPTFDSSISSSYILCLAGSYKVLCRFRSLLSLFAEKELSWIESILLRWSLLHIIGSEKMELLASFELLSRTLLRIELEFLSSTSSSLLERRESLSE